MTELLTHRIPDTYEVRSVAEVRADADLGTFDGHASVFWAADDHVSAFTPKAFRKTIADKGDRLAVHYFHDPMAVVGPITTLREDKVGLFHESRAVEDNSHGSYVLAHLRAGRHMGMSFGFRTVKDRAATDDDPVDLSTGPTGLKNTDVRLITEVELYELSVLPWAFASQPKAGPGNVRTSIQIDEASALLDALKAGTLTDEQRALCEQIVAAWSERAGADLPTDDHSTPDEARRNRDRQIAIALMEAQWGSSLGVITV